MCFNFSNAFHENILLFQISLHFLLNFMFIVSTTFSTFPLVSVPFFPFSLYVCLFLGFPNLFEQMDKQCWRIANTLPYSTLYLGCCFYRTETFLYNFYDVYGFSISDLHKISLISDLHVNNCFQFIKYKLFLQIRVQYEILSP